MFEKDPLLNLSSSPHSPHNIIPKLIKKENPLILDIGCNTGLVGNEIIKKKGNVVIDGVDINAEALEKAKSSYRKVFERDLYKSNIDIDSEKYDYIIFSDILEHLPRPDLLLNDVIQYLKNDGVVIISLPNIARLEIRLKLFFGNFDYAPGILSEDHLRFFTKKSAIDMINKCGYSAIDVIPTGLGHMVGIFPTLTAFQFIYVCKKR